MLVPTNRMACRATSAVWEFVRAEQGWEMCCCSLGHATWLGPFLSWEMPWHTSISMRRPCLIATKLTFASWTWKVACARWWTGVAALLLLGATWLCCQWLGGQIRLAEALWWARLDLAARHRWSTHMCWVLHCGCGFGFRGARGCGLLACRGWRKSVWWSHLCRLCCAGSLAQCRLFHSALSRKNWRYDGCTLAPATAELACSPAPSSGTATASAAMPPPPPPWQRMRARRCR